MTFKKTETVTAWAMPHQSREHGGVSGFLAALASGASSLSHASFTNLDMSSSGYIKIGTAQITVEFVPPESLTAAELEMLNKKLAELREQYHQAESAILSQISKLQALPFVPSMAEQLQDEYVTGLDAVSPARG